MPEAERTARACEAWTREVMRRLEGERLNVITLKWFGRPRPVPSFLERHGVTGAFAADSAFLRGLGTALGLEPVDAPETDDPVGDLRGRVALARERLDAGDTFVFCHQKTTDAAGHTKDPDVKRDTIEALDAALADLPTDRAIVCITGDHATPASPDVIHSGDPVPLLVAGPGVRADARRALRRARLRGRDPRPAARARPDAGAPERRRPAALPRLAPDAVRGRRRLPGPARAASLAFTRVEATTARLRRIELSPARFFQLTLVSLGALWLIVVTGAAVRVTDSGLGCRHWPGCEQGHPLPAKSYHAFIEFGNRALGGVVIVLVLLTAVSSFFVPGLPRRARRLALAIFVGTLAQAPLGYLAVHSDLHWPVVAAHLLLSMALLAGAVVLALEALALRSGRAEPVAPLELRRGALAVTAAAGVLLVTGALATAGGPHSGGGAQHVDRLWRLQPLIFVHAAAVAVFAVGARVRARLPRLAAAALAAAVHARPGRLRRAAGADGARARCSTGRTCRGRSCSSTSASPPRSGRCWSPS